MQNWLCFRHGLLYWDFFIYKRGVIPLDYREKMKRLEKVSELHLLEIYRVCMCLVNDEEVAGQVARKAFLELYKNMENIRVEMYRTYLIYYAKTFAEEHLRNEDYKGGRDGKED